MISKNGKTYCQNDHHQITYSFKNENLHCTYVQTSDYFICARKEYVSFIDESKKPTYYQTFNIPNFKIKKNHINIDSLVNDLNKLTLFS